MPKIGYGTTFTWNNVVVAGITKINGIEIAVEEIDNTTLSSPDAVEEAGAGMVKPGDVSLEGFFEYTDTTGQQAMLTDAFARTTRTGVITLPVSTGASWTFSGFVKAIKIGDADKSGNIPFTATVKPAGKPTFAIAASNNLTNLVFTTAILYPAFAAGTYLYTGTTSGTTFTVTPTFSAGTCTITANGVSQTVGTGVPCSAISAGTINTVTPVTLVVAEANKAPKTYTVYVAKTA